MKILIAEDDVVSRKVLRGHLEKWGYEVIETTNGDDAWAAYQADKFPMAVLDWMMPGIDGLELVRRIRQSRRPIYTYVILLSAKWLKEDIVEGIESGADDYVTKPFDREELRVRVLAGQRILELQTALLRAEKGNSVGQVALGLSRELYEPIGQIRENLVLLRSDMLTLGEQIAAQHEFDPASPTAGERLLQSSSITALFNRSLEMVVRVQDTLRNLRDFAHADEFQMKPINIAPALMEVSDMVRRLAETKAVEVQQEISQLPAINGNAGKLKKVILHLLVNAIDAVDRRGTVTLRASHENNQVIIQVQDNGRGIAPAHLPHIFEPFYLLRLPADRGLGLGLAISDAIVREHGGTLEVQSEVGHGTTFTIRIPALSSDPTVEVTIHTTDSVPQTELANS
jgi:two-component system NtrC family sensor kinase